MANTTNYNWETPDDTDLVKDGAAAIRTLGSSIDTTTKALNPETTLGDIAYRSSTANTNTRLAIGSNGQILGVSGGVPAWINNDQGDITEVAAGTGISVASGTGPIPTVSINTAVTADLTTAQTLTNKTLTSPVLTTPSLSTIDAKGDLIVGSADNTIARLAVGTDGHVLTADSVATNGIKWAAPAGGGKVLQVVEGTKTGQASSSSSSYADIGLSVSITPSSSASKILVFATCSSVTKYGGNTNVGFKLLRGSTSIFATDAIATTNTTATNSIGTVSLVKLDSPSTTSATTYKVQMANVDSAGTVAVNDYVASNTVISTIIAMEIGA
jgi:hypothetical protein